MRTLERERHHYTTPAAHHFNLQPFALKSLTATLDWAPGVGAAPQGQMQTLERGRYGTHSFNSTSLELSIFNSQITHCDNWIEHLVVGAAPYELKVILEGGRYNINRYLYWGSVGSLATDG